MTSKNHAIRKQPWASGPGEILSHGLRLLSQDNDTNRRLAMLSIDNAVELMLKTYLGLPQRETGLSISRREYDEISESFPRLLDAIHKHKAKDLEQIDLSEVEWYHRLRNQLYHEGNGLTVEKEKVVHYSDLAKLLFEALFDIPLTTPELTKLASIHSVADSTGLVSSPRKAWFFLESTRGNLFVATVNARGSCSVRTFRVDDGVALEKKYGTGDYQTEFGAFLKGAREIVPSRQPNLERECRERLPVDVLASLRKHL